MSHTDKTDPIWVRRNDPTLMRSVDHDHRHLGEARYRDRLVLDADGNPIRVPVDTQTHIEWVIDRWGAAQAGLDYDYVRKHPHLYPEFARRTEAPEPREGHYTVGRRGSYTYLRERYLAYTIADHCTGDEPVTREDSWQNRPCMPTLTGASYWALWHGYDGPTRDDKREFHGMDRARTRDSLRAYTKQVNASEDWTDLDDSEIPHGERRHTIIWW